MAIDRQCLEVNHEADDLDDAVVEVGNCRPFADEGRCTK